MDLNIHPTAALEGYQLSQGLQWDIQPNSHPSWSSQCRNNSEVFQQMKIPYIQETAGEIQGAKAIWRDVQQHLSISAQHSSFSCQSEERQDG